MMMLGQSLGARAFASRAKIRLFQAASVMGLALVGTQPAFAQEAAAEEQQDDLSVNQIIVTAQKRAENLQDVPIAVSAFGPETLQERGLLGGEDLELAVPNLSFQGNTGFGGTNFQVRGVGAQVEGISADTGVGIHVNAVPITVGRFAQSEFYDLERVEVLRGPQGTLYGRNATGGVVNLITAKPEDVFSGRLNAEYGNFETVRIGGHLNLPLTDTLAVRFAGNLIKRDGTIFNEGTGNDIDDRDIWSTRVTVGFEPSSSIRAYLMWEHFDQDDKSGGTKALCATDPGPDSVGGVPTNPFTRLFLSNGCLETDVSDPSNFQGGNSLSMFPAVFGFNTGATGPNAFAGFQNNPSLSVTNYLRDNQTVAENDLVTLDLSVDVGGGLTLTSLSSYSRDEAFFANPFLQTGVAPGTFNPAAPGINPDGTFTDPTLGTLPNFHSESQVDSDTEQWSQELRLASDWDGPFNFNVGAIYIDLDRSQNVNIVTNTTTLFAQQINAGFGPGGPLPPGLEIFIDQSPDRVTGLGRNYLSIQSEYQLEAAALSGEFYYEISDTLQATLGARYTRDNKTFLARAPLFLVPGPIGDPASQGQLDTPVREVTFNELTGRFTLDWQASDDHLVYASISRGYKGGGFNTVNPAGLNTFDPEFVNAIEIGTKSSIAGGRGTLNLTGFGYDYKGYQITQLVNGTAVNFNTDAQLFGLELESTFRVTSAFEVNAAVGYLHSDIADGTTKLNPFNLTQGDPNFVAVNTIAGPGASTQCILPVAEVAGVLGAINAGAPVPPVLLGLSCPGAPAASPNALPGFQQDVSGNNLPLAPKWTAAFGAQYSVDLTDDWSAVLRGDYSYRASAFSEVFNDLYDRVPGSSNLNMSLLLSSSDNDLDIQFYLRNLLSQNTVIENRVLSTNPGNYRAVRGKDPVMYGIRVSKSF